MTDLTEQWKKGDLPSGWYYTKLWKGCNVIDYFIGNQFLRYDDSDIVEIIAIVPSYDEWKALDKSDKSNAQSSIRFSLEAAILRELLKECKPYFEALVDKRLKLEYIPRVAKLLQQIDEVLK
jgi:hypothetical protein